MKANDLLPFSEAIKAVGRPITFYPSLAKALGSVKVGVFISNFLFWEGRQKDSDGWIYKMQSEIFEETGLSRNEQETARKVLRDLGILFEKKEGIPQKLHYRFDWIVLDQVLRKYNDGESIEKKKEKDPSVIYQMKEIFDLKYIEVTNGIEFEWSKDKNSGKHWKGLKLLRDYFGQRIKTRQKDENYVPTEEELLLNWTMFLDSVPEYHQRNLTPVLLYSNINEIIKDIIIAKNGKSTDKTKARTSSGSTASEYV